MLPQLVSALLLGGGSGDPRPTTAASVREVGRLQPGTQHAWLMSMSVSSRADRAPATLLFLATTLRVLSTAAPAQPVTHLTH